MLNAPAVENQPSQAGVKALLGALILVLAACALPQRPDPQFPGRHWIEKAQPPLARELRDPPNLLEASGRALGFDDCVFLALQQSPGLIHSAVELETTRLRKESAYWSQFPEVRAVLGVTHDLTRKDGAGDEGSAETEFWVGFAVNAFNPVANYFSYEAAELIQQIAVLTHQKAIETLAEQIGEILLRIELLAAVRQQQELLPELAQQAAAYWRTARPGEAYESLEFARAVQKQKQARAILDKTDAETAALRLNLKLLLGLDPDQTFELEPSFEKRFKTKPSGLDQVPSSDWGPAWEENTETRISRLALRLQDFNILLAWSRYLPEAGFELYSGSPGSTRAGDSAGDDAYAVFKLSLPLLDYGRRARGVEEARVQKTKTVESLRQHRLGFSQRWTQSDQHLKLLAATLALAQENLALARIEARRAAIEFESGQSSLTPALESREKVTQEEIRVAEALFQLRRQKLSRHFLSGDFARRFFAPPPGAKNGAPAS
jgi:outer membrane protein TolC